MRIVVGHTDAGDAVQVDVGQHGLVVVAGRELVGATFIDYLALGCIRYHTWRSRCLGSRSGLPEPGAAAAAFEELQQQLPTSDLQIVYDDMSRDRDRFDALTMLSALPRVATAMGPVVDEPDITDYRLGTPEPSEVCKAVPDD